MRRGSAEELQIDRIVSSGTVTSITGRRELEKEIEMQGVGLQIMPSVASLAAPDMASGANWSREVEEIDPTGKRETALIGVFQKRGQVGIMGSQP